MYFCFDTDYAGEKACCAGLGFRDFAEEEPAAVYTKIFGEIAPYEPGNFYKRELPCILGVLAEIKEPVDLIFVDGFVNLGPERRGLGAYLYEATAGKIPVIGVAKNYFVNCESVALPVLRGESQKPLWVSAAGFDLAQAADIVQIMGGKYRFPTILKAADSVCRAW